MSSEGTSTDVKEENRSNFGKLVQSDNEIILLDSGLPFLVIEPANTEYRILNNIII